MPSKMILTRKLREQRIPRPTLAALHRRIDAAAREFAEAKREARRQDVERAEIAATVEKLSGDLKRYGHRRDNGDEQANPQARDVVKTLAK